MPKSPQNPESSDPYSCTAASAPALCSSEPRIISLPGDDESVHRFMELGGENLIWQPDAASPFHLSADESVKLEGRGTTSQISRKLHPRLRKLPQLEFWKTQSIHKHIVADKLRQAGLEDTASKLDNCHTYYTVCQCCQCRKVRKFPNRCDLFCCPECQASLAADRRKQVEWWVNEVRQPKHVCLTLKNTATLTRKDVVRIRTDFARLRRRKFCKNWNGGFYSIEVTNEGKGWHLHLHALVDSVWIDQLELAKQWQSVTKGRGRIVWAKRARSGSFVVETAKYIVKGNMLAAWSPDELKQFVESFGNLRIFGVFGSLYGKRTKFAEWIAELKSVRPRCSCGSCLVKYYSELDWLIHEEIGSGPAPARPPPPPPDHQMSWD